MTIVTPEEDKDGNLVLPISDEMMAELGWKIGDNIKWTDNNDGSWSMTKKPETELVLVECVSTFRMRYVVEVPKGHSMWALDTVTMNEADEFSQEHLGEQIVSHRVVSEDEVIALSNVDNHYCSTWPREKKLETFVTEWKEENE
jgi:hypothetical protein